MQLSLFMFISEPIIEKMREPLWPITGRNLPFYYYYSLQLFHSRCDKFLCLILYIAEFIRFEAFTAATMKNGVFWDVTPCGSCKNRRFGRTYRLLHQGDKNR
jgi:hypothetical protein